MNIYVIGFMGTGKTTVGQALAFRIGWTWVDMDQELEKRENRTIADIFATDGEAYFREQEARLLEELSRRQRLLVTTGGGVVLRAANRERMRQTGCVISLTADKQTIKDRVSQQANRPLLAGDGLDQRIDRLLQERRGLYDDADLVVDTSGRDVSEIVAEIVRHPALQRAFSAR